MQNSSISMMPGDIAALPRYYRKLLNSLNAILIFLAATQLAGCLPMYVTYLEPSAKGSTVSRDRACHGAIEKYLTVLEYEEGGLRLTLNSLEMRYSEDRFAIILWGEISPEAVERFYAESAFATLEIPKQGRRHLIDLRNSEVLLDQNISVEKRSPVEIPLRERRFHRMYWFSFKDTGFDTGRAILILPVLQIGERRIAIPPIELNVRRTIAIEYNC